MRKSKSNPDGLNPVNNGKTGTDTRNPIYLETAAYGHMGKDYYVGSKTFNKGHKNEKTIEGLEFFTWEKLDKVDEIKKEFSL